MSARKVKAPPTLRIGGNTWTVEFQENWVINDDSGDLCYGLCDYAALKLTVASGPKFNAQQIRKALLHEIVHACVRTYGGVLAGEEDFVLGVENGLYQVLRDPHNKWALDFILEED